MAVDESGREMGEMDKDCGGSFDGDEWDVSTLVSWISVDGICMIMKFWRGTERIRNLVGCVPRNGISMRGGDFLAVPDRSILSRFLSDKLRIELEILRAEIQTLLWIKLKIKLFKDL